MESKKEKTNTRLSKLHKVRMKYLFIQSVIDIVIAAGFICLGFSLNLVPLWEGLEDQFDSYSYVTFIIFRILFYFLPGLVSFALVMLLRKPKGKERITAALVDCYKIQFFAYSAVFVIYDFFDLATICHFDLFSSMSTFILLLSFVFSLLSKREVSVESVYMNDEDMEIQAKELEKKQKEISEKAEKNEMTLEDKIVKKVILDESPAEKLKEKAEDFKKSL